MTRTCVALTVALIVSFPVAAQASEAEPCASGIRLEVGPMDDRLMMILTQTAPLVQQFTGFTAAIRWPILCAGLWPGGGIAWTVGGETGVSFDSTGLCRWLVRASEQSTFNTMTGNDDPPPALTARLIFGMPLYVPARVRTEAELTLLPGWSIQLGAEAAVELLLYGGAEAAIRLDFGGTLGTFISIGKGWGAGLRLRLISYGDERDRWPGFGATAYTGFSL